MTPPAAAADPPRERLTLFSGPCDRSSPLAVRQRLSSVSAQTMPIAMLAGCQLIATELVSNALNARADWLDIDLLLFDDHLELCVKDEVAGIPELQHPSSTDLHGRGLGIVQAIASAWGFRLEPDQGKTVWARLDLPTLL